MSVRLACDAADQVAAIGTVAAAVDDLSDCSPSRPVPVMAFHGTKDPVVSYAGGPFRRSAFRWVAELSGAPTSFLGAEHWVALWAEGNGCKSAPEFIPQQGDVWGKRYVGCDQDAEVILYTIEGGGHTWPGGMPIPVGKTSRSIDATEEMWGFFEGFRLAGQS
jgi:polyhydroxybutyrate depolymerase